MVKVRHLPAAHAVELKRLVVIANQAAHGEEVSIEEARELLLAVLVLTWTNPVRKPAASNWPKLNDLANAFAPNG